MCRAKNRRVKGPDSVSLRVIMIIALWEMGITDVEEISYLIKMSVPRVEELIQLIKRSRARIIREYLKNGLPIGVNARLPEPQTVECPLCSARIDTVPCLKCRLINAAIERVAEEGEPDDPPFSEFPTRFLPGSAHKIEVLRVRESAGESLFHPGDAKIVT